MSVDVCESFIYSFVRSIYIFYLCVRHTYNRNHEILGSFNYSLAICNGKTRKSFKVRIRISISVSQLNTNKNSRDSSYFFKGHDLSSPHKLQPTPHGTAPTRSQNPAPVLRDPNPSISAREFPTIHSTALQKHDVVISSISSHSPCSPNER